MWHQLYGYRLGLELRSLAYVPQIFPQLSMSMANGLMQLVSTST